MLCLPALTPVANDAHAVGLSGEWVVSRRKRPPCAGQLGEIRQLALPSSSVRARSGSIPSKPRMTSFCLNADGRCEEHASTRSAHRERPAPATSRSPVANYTARSARARDRLRRASDRARAERCDGTLASPWRLHERPASEAETLTLLVARDRAADRGRRGLAAVVWAGRGGWMAAPTHQTAHRRSACARARRARWRAGGAAG